MRETAIVEPGDELGLGKRPAAEPTAEPASERTAEPAPAMATAHEAPVTERALERGHSVVSQEGRAVDRRSQVEKYFLPTPWPGRLANARLGLIGGSIGVLLGLFFLFWGPALGVALLGGGGYLAYKAFVAKKEYDAEFALAEPKPTDRELDGYLAYDLYDLEDRALTRLGLASDDLEDLNTPDPIASLVENSGAMEIERPTHRPMVVFGPDRNSNYAVGNDGIYRFQRYEVMVLCPTSHHLGLYACTLDIRTGEFIREQTQEYHYSDIVTLSTFAEPIGDELLCCFQVVATSGDRCEIVVGVPFEEKPKEQHRIHDSGLEGVLDTLRKLLREKKSAL